MLLRGTVGRGFRAPSFKELAWDFANVGAGYTVQGYPDLEPERSWSVSSGAEWAVTPRLTLSVEAYRNDIDNLIEFAFVGNTPSGLLVYSPRNVYRARTQGLEATGSAAIGPLKVVADYAFLDARSLDDDLPLDRRARHSARLRAGGTVPVLEGARLDVTTHLTGDAPLIGVAAGGSPAEVGTQEALLAVDLQLTLQVPGDLRLLVGADNVFDTRPDGWQGALGRRLRAGVEARSLF